VRDGQLWKVVGNPDDPLSRGRLCPHGTGGIGAHSDPDRLRAPLIRLTAHGSEEWVGVTWDEALGYVADPRFSIAASKARHDLPVRPGTDLALLLAWRNAIFAEDLYDRSFGVMTSEHWAIGVSKFGGQQRMRQQLTACEGHATRHTTNEGSAVHGRLPEASRFNIAS
jgi:predicted molibdopterin-dependent oxidoreductase YjgC